MSANLDLVRSVYADWERGDFSSGYSYCLIGLPDDCPAAGTWSGVAGMARGKRQLLSPRRISTEWRTRQSLRTQSSLSHWWELGSESLSLNSGAQL
jgi:hypothetical protein